MYRKLCMLTVLVAVAAMCLPLAAQGTGDKFWPQWRGPQMSGVSRSANPPTEWSETKNIRWKVEIARARRVDARRLGRSRLCLDRGPPVDGHRRTARSTGFVVMAINRKDGKVVWQQTAREEAPHEGTHQDFGTMASARRSPTASM